MAVRMYNFERPQLQVFVSVLTKSTGYQQKEKRSKKEKVYTL